MTRTPDERHALLLEKRHETALNRADGLREKRGEHYDLSALFEYGRDLAAEFAGFPPSCTRCVDGLCKACRWERAEALRESVDD